MKEFKGTKGKWNYHVTQNKNDRPYHNIQKGDWGDAIALLYPHHVTEEELEANAKLIAAAPEMLEVILEIYNECRFRSDIISFEVSKKLKPIITKALGE